MLNERRERAHCARVYIRVTSCNYARARVTDFTCGGCCRCESFFQRNCGSMKSLGFETSGTEKF